METASTAAPEASANNNAGDKPGTLSAAAAEAMAKAMGQGTNGKRGKLPAVPLKTKCGLGRCIKTTDLQDCAACKQICYCGKEHQVEHFKEGHKLVCPGRTKGAPLAFQDCVNKASQYFERGMWVAALPYYAAILELTERHAGVFHPQTVLALDGMATCMLKQGKWDELSELLTRILLTKDMHHDQSIAYSRDVYNLTGRLADAYLRAGKVDVARTLLEKTEASAATEFGEASFERGKALMALAVCSESEGEVEEAEALLRKAIAIDGYGATTDKQQKVIASNGYFNLGVVLFNQGKFKDAEKFFEKTVLFRVQGGVAGDHPDMAEAKTYLADCRSKVAA